MSMLGHGAFFFNTTAKVISAFGNLFNGIQVVRFSGTGNQGTPVRTIQVPLRYGPIAKWIAQINEQKVAGVDVRTRISMPIMSFQMSGAPVYDASRKTNTMNRTGREIPNTSGAEFISQLNRIPIDIPLELNIGAKYPTDGLMILEQILPFFQPSFTVNIKDVPELDIVNDVPIIFAGLEAIDQYEGEFTEDRVYQWRLNFVAKSYMYKPLTDAALIKKVIISLYGDQAMTVKDSTITVAVNPLTASEQDVYEIDTTIVE